MAPSTYQQQPLADKPCRNQNVVWDLAGTKLELESRPRRGNGKVDEKKAAQNGRTSITIKFLRCGTPERPGEAHTYVCAKIAYLRGRNKGAPARESRTGTWLVSPAATGEKKNSTPAEQGLATSILVH
jgi:hypothetical protein